jgi:hypothetical protein
MINRKQPVEAFTTRMAELMGRARRGDEMMQDAETKMVHLEGVITSAGYDVTDVMNAIRDQGLY